MQSLTILGDEITSKALNYGVNCHQIKLRSNSALIFTATATSEGLFPPLEGCFCHPGLFLIVLHSFLAQYLKTSIVCIFSSPVEIPLWQSYKHRKANNDVFSILCHQMCVLFAPLGVGRRVGWLHIRENLRTTQFALRCTRSEQ